MRKIGLCQKKWWKIKKNWKRWKIEMERKVKKWKQNWDGNMKMVKNKR